MSEQTGKTEAAGYIRSFCPPANTELSRLLSEHANRNNVAPCIGEDAANFLTWLIKFTKAKNVIEFGTCIGYSTIALAEAVKTNSGHLTSIESAANHFRETGENLKKAGLTEYVTLINGDALKEFKKIDAEFDMILQDSLKSIYPEMLEDCVSKLRKGGILIADDTLFLPLGIAPKHAVFTDRYNKMVFADKRLDSFILPIGDGLTVSFKI